MYAGRFAPSPTGPLHFGSLVAALASWLDARASGGRWGVRIEDLDTPRVQPGAALQILGALERLGLVWDGEVAYQSTRTARYARALEELAAHTYACGCSRREIADSSLGLACDGAQIYPGSCRGGLAAGKAARSIRVRTAGATVRFEDRVQGLQQQMLDREVGDFVLYRADGQFSYQIAVVVDDAADGITDIVRGADLLDSAPRQIYLQRLLGYRQPRYLHVPVAVNRAGEKLSKQTGAPALDLSRREMALRSALQFLGQPVTESLEEAVRHWDAGRVPARRAIIVE
jgi:glutamyl-Q tRNA(Asp) synthetase